MENKNPNEVGGDAEGAQQPESEKKDDAKNEEQEFDYYDEEDDENLTDEQREKKKKFAHYVEIFEGVCDTLQSPEIQGSLGKFFGDHKDLFEKDKEEYNHEYKDVYE